MNWKRLLGYLLAGSTAAGTPIFMSQAGLFDRGPEKIYYQVPSDSLRRIDAPSDEATYRTSDEQDETSTFYTHAGTSKKKPKGKRIGCICMDEQHQSTTGTGACAGHGGVRYWLYAEADGSIVQFPTKAHRDHPQPLSEEELANLNAKRKAKSGTWVGGLGPFEVLFSLIVCITVIFIVHQVFNRPPVA